VRYDSRRRRVCTFTHVDPMVAQKINEGWESAHRYIIGALIGTVVFVAGPELARWAYGGAFAQSQTQPTSPSSTTGGNSSTSTGQSGGINNSGTIVVNPPPQTARPEVIDQLSLYMDQGATIAQAWVDTNNLDALKSAESEWAQTVYNYIRTTLGVSYAIQFKNTHEVSAVGLVGHSLEGNAVWHEVTGKVGFINQLINGLRTR
jgi:hypothetical protein